LPEIALGLLPVPLPQGISNGLFAPFAHVNFYVIGTQNNVRKLVGVTPDIKTVRAAQVLML